MIWILEKLLNRNGIDTEKSPKWKSIPSTILVWMAIVWIVLVLSQISPLIPDLYWLFQFIIKTGNYQFLFSYINLFAIVGVLIAPAVHFLKINKLLNLGRILSSIQQNHKK
ncbi:hypothetical protein [Viridibacillus arvi]|uniref:hypothetical protein n=1 Tax=Viridibacillus arvi TaxID=263475 RepID=UPI0034CE75C7